jgi:hypothetical protein
MRSYLDFAFNDKAKGMKGGLLKEKDLKDSHVQELKAFFNQLGVFPLMLDLEGKKQRIFGSDSFRE